MIIIPEQLSYIRKEVQTAKKQIDEYRECQSIEGMDSIEFIPGAIIRDHITDNQYQMKYDEYHYLTKLLLDSEYLITRQTDYVDIGTKFTIQYDGDDELETFILAETSFGPIPEHHIVTIKSPIGQNVLGKKEGETFEFVVTGRRPTDTRRIKGTIVEIKNNPEDYIHYIKEKEMGVRISHAEKKSRKQLYLSSEQEDKEILERNSALSMSQYNMLQIEEHRLSRRAKDPASAIRLTNIRKLLATAKIMTPPEDDTIGIGSVFEIMLSSDGKETTSHTYEMINYAVSDELEDEYVERISPLGQQLYGLKANDTFTIRKNRKNYNGIVVSVDNTKSTTDTLNSSMQYQKK